MLYTLYIKLKFIKITVVGEFIVNNELKQMNISQQSTILKKKKKNDQGRNYVPVVIYHLCGSEDSRCAYDLFFTVMNVSLNLRSSSDRTMIDVSQFKKPSTHMMGLL